MKHWITLRQQKEFKRAYFRGGFCANPYLVCYAVGNGLGVNRVGITTSKKIGNAVTRNTARRKIRAAYFSLVEDIDRNHKGYDFVFVARGRTCEKRSTELSVLMQKQIELAIHRFHHPEKKKRS